MSGSFGYELNPEKLSEEDKKEIRRQIAKRNELAHLIYNGKYYRLSNPGEGESAAWAFVSEDQSEALINYVNLQIHGNRHVTYIRLCGLESGAVYRDKETGRSGAVYRDKETGREYPADALMEMGMPMPVAFGDYGAVQICLERV